MAARPWVLPQNVIDYTDNPKIKARPVGKLEVDISRAELYVINYTRNRFDDPDKYPVPPGGVVTAVILIAEMYACGAVETGDIGSGSFKSASYDEFSYTLADTAHKQENLDLGPLLDEFILAAPRNAVNMKLRKL